ncbi:SusC/RagA family TonB-linked outer membrane protein [Chitinophaga sp. NPDC101104]|uniref:SusC/RagA family TonB-linked outer membrane protein n=1 Tax=Chitinophaga sp. NPDC101104 TaxID=3390561 RepID=UPI003D08E215
MKMFFMPPSIGRQRFGAIVAGLFLMLLPLLTEAQQRSITVKGLVANQQGVGLPGAAVGVRGSSEGVATKEDGSFSIRVPENSILRISYVGFVTQEVNIGTSAPENLRITLSADKGDLNEVIVVGYGKQKKSDVTGSIVSINEQTLKQTPVNNISAALQGQAAGVDIQKGGGNSKPGAAPRILIRGNRSLNASNDPLFVVDGIPYNGNINDLNQDDVVSVEVLKDASATAIYGSRGANGVILISTRRGKSGKARVTYNGYAGIVKPRGKFPVMNGEEFFRFKQWAKYWGAISTPGAYTGIDDPRLNQAGEEFTPTEIDNYKAGKGTDWQDLIYHTGTTTDHQIGISGGSESTQYALSGAYFRETGIYYGQSFERYSLKATIDHAFSNKLKLGISSLNNYSVTMGESNNPMSQALRANPLASPYDSTGALVGFVIGNANQVWNPLANEIPNAVAERRKRFGTFTNLFLDYEFIPGLKYRFNAGAEIRSDLYGSFSASNTTYNLGALSRSTNQNRLSTNYTLENIFTYEKTFAQKHRLHATAVYSYQQSNYQRNDFSNNNVPGDFLEYFAPQFAQNHTGTGEQEQWSIISYMGRVNYGYDNRYLLTLTMRSDGSSRLAPGNHFQIFPSASAAWNISNEAFLRGNSTINALRLIASYGRTGNTAIDPYQTLGSLRDVRYNYGPDQTAIGAYLNTIPNPNLTWEYTATTNLRLEFGLWNNRISGSAEVYKQNTSDLLLPKTLPPTSGIPEPILLNVGKTENKGLEIQLNTQNIVARSRDHFGWSTDMNFFMNRGKIVELSEGVINDIANGRFVGQPIGVYYDLVLDGIWQNTPGDSAWAREYKQTLTGNGSVIGNIRYKDINGDKKMNSDDRTFIGSPQATWQGGMTNRFTFKGFDLTVSAFARMGGMISSNLHKSGNAFVHTYQSNYNNLRVNYWTPENGETRYPKPNANNTNAPNVSLLSYFDGSFVKIRSIGLGYTLSPAVLKRIGLGNLRIYSTLEDPFIVYSPFVKKYGGLDPETAGNLAADTPPVWSAVFGVNVTF